MGGMLGAGSMISGTKVSKQAKNIQFKIIQTYLGMFKIEVVKVLSPIIDFDQDRNMHCLMNSRFPLQNQIM